MINNNHLVAWPQDSVYNLLQSRKSHNKNPSLSVTVSLACRVRWGLESRTKVLPLPWVSLLSLPQTAQLAVSRQLLTLNHVKRRDKRAVEGGKVARWRVCFCFLPRTSLNLLIGSGLEPTGRAGLPPRAVFYIEEHLVREGIF